MTTETISGSAMSDAEFRRAVGAADDLLRRRALAEAARACAALTARAPDRAESWLLAARASQMRGDFPAMADAAVQAVKLAATNPIARFIRVESLFHTGKTLEARAALEAIEAAAGEDAGVWARLALAHTHAGRHADAERCARTVLRLKPGDPDMRHACATAAIALGRLDDAERLFDDLISDHPEFADAWYNRATVRRWTPERNHVAELRAQLATRRGDLAATAPLAYALGKEFEDLGDDAAAFASFAEGAKARRAQLSYDVAADVETIDAIIDAFDADYVSRAAAEPTRADDGPIFVVGLPRSGTTLVERILAKHPEVDSVGEAQDLALAVMRAGGPAADKRALIAATAAADPALVGEEYWDAICGYGVDAPYVVDKTPLNFLYIGLILRALPQAKIVHVRRHPMASGYAVFKTLFRMGYPFSYDLEDIGRYYVAYRKLMAHWTSVAPRRVLTVCYETLVDHQESVSRRIIDHCGLAWDPACLAFHDNAAPTATASAAQVRQPIYRHARDLWRVHAEALAPLARVLDAAGIETS